MGALSAFCYADLDMSTEHIQEVRKDTEETIRAMGGAVDLSTLTECMNYAQNYNTLKMMSPMQELSKIEETFKVEVEEDSPD